MEALHKEYESRRVLLSRNSGARSVPIVINEITRSLRYKTLTVPRDYRKRGLCQNLSRFLQGVVKTGYGKLELLANRSEVISLNQSLPLKPTIEPIDSVEASR